MKKAFVVLLCSVLVVSFIVYKDHSCSTFMLKHEGRLIVGHNVDHGYHLSGMVVINKRDVYKKGQTWKELSSNEKELATKPTWTSRYGSVTFNAWGYGFPDGGVNEAGLFIWEMTLEGTKFIENEKLPKLFMNVWMQYQLDNHETIDQVIRSASEIALDGWDWHFFTTDASGRCASIEFLDGQPVVHSGAAMPVTALCNETYEDGLKLLEQYEGFGGDKRLWLSDKSVPRFVHAAQMLGNFSLCDSGAIVDYGLRILENLDRGGTQWSVVCDLIRREIYFRTSASRRIRYFSCNAFDFTKETPVKILDINADYSGDVATHFIDYSSELNREFVGRGINSVTGGAETSQLQKIGFIGKDITKEILIDRLANFPKTWENDQ
ncbi:MAG: linear amide C-N hydrolase [Candidatus Aminicenantes bacterium]|nr:linear amide C-N hydrolase [Candidatus Aminicenantes bacterium]